MKRTLTLETLEDRLLLAGDIFLVRQFDTWNGAIPSTDPAGIAYHAPSGRLYIADSEINEIPEFNGYNIFETTLLGDPLIRELRSAGNNSANLNTEPTGITYLDGFFYVTNDDWRTVTRYDINFDAVLGQVETIPIQNRAPYAPGNDPEGITADPQTGLLYVADGSLGARQVMVYNSNLVFQRSFSVADRMQDAEGIAFHEPSGNLFLLDGNQEKIFEYTTGGQYIKEFDISTLNSHAVQGLTFAPTSNPNDGDALALYIADGMIDNFPDGRVYETVIQDDGASTAVLSVSQGSDDAKEKSDGNVNIGEDRLKLGNNETVGIRFAGVNIPQRAIILNAYVQFEAKTGDSGTALVSISGQAADNANTFVNSAFNITSRVTTIASVAWSPPAWLHDGDAGPAQQTPDLTAILQEIVDRPGWSSGNALSMIISGTGKREAKSFERDGIVAAPRLVVQYLPLFQPPNNAPPVAVDDSYAVLEGGTLMASDAAGTLGDVSDDGVLANDSDPEEQPIFAGLVSGPAHAASFSLSGDGTFTYVHDGSETTSDSFTYRANDGFLDSAVATVNIAITPVDDPLILDSVVSQGSDDAKEKSDGNVNNGEDRLKLGNNETVGIRFAGLNIPRNAIIESAFVQFEAKETDSVSTNVTIRGQDADNAATFLETNNNISSRAQTAAAVNWSLPSWPTKDAAGPDQRTPDIAALIQEIVARPGWSSGNALAILVTGTGVREAKSYERDNGAAPPRLHVEYHEPNQLPQALDDSYTVLQGGVLTADDAEGTIGDASDDGILINDTDDNGDTLTASLISGPAHAASFTLDPNGTFTYVHDGSATLTDSFVYVANDGEANSNPATVTIDITTVSNSVVVESRVSGGSDDAEERGSGAVELTSGDLDLGQQTVGLRFANLQIPRGASITNAYIQFQADEAGGAATDVTIRGQFSGDAPTFSGAGHDISSRPQTSESVSWSVDPWLNIGDAGPSQRTPNLASVVESIISRNDWANGNSLVLIFQGSGARAAESFEGKAVAAPLLHLEYTGGANLSPVVDAGPNQTIILPSAAQLDGTVSDDGQPNPSPEVTWALSSGPDAVIFGDEHAEDTTATFSVPGTYVLSLMADDGAAVSSDVVTIEVIPPQTVQTVDIRITEGQDDAEQFGSAGTMDLPSSDLDLGQKVLGLRFPGVAIPQGAVIVSASVQFQADESGSAATNTTIHGQLSADAMPFTSAPFDITSRPQTANSVNWSVDPWSNVGDAGTAQQTPDLAAVIEEIVGQPGWLAGSSLVLILTGSGARAAESREGSQNGAPLLHVEYADAAALRVEPSVAPQGSAATLSDTQLAPIIAAAMARLADSGGSDATPSLAGVTIEIVDLPDNLLGQASAGTIRIDADAAGYGWFVDLSPRDDLEFAFDAASGQLVAPLGPAASRVDLLTVVMHELRHVQGDEHTDNHSLMDPVLPLGTRRLREPLHVAETSAGDDSVLADATALDARVLDGLFGLLGDDHDDMSWKIFRYRF